MKKLLIITTKEDRTEELFIHDKLKIDISYYSSESLSDVKSRTGYDFVYFRDPFNTGEYNLEEISELIDIIRKNNPRAYYFDDASSIEDMLIEDKWIQAELFGSLMPHTELVDDFSKIYFDKQFVKKRISSRARGIVFSSDEFEEFAEPNDYIVQEKLNIIEEYRVIAVRGILLEEMVRKSSKTATQKVVITGEISLTKDIRQFANRVIAKTPNLDLIGLDIVRLVGGGLRLIEINRSPQFISFTKFTGKNPFKILVSKLSSAD